MRSNLHTPVLRREDARRLAADATIGDAMWRELTDAKIENCDPFDADHRARCPFSCADVITFGLDLSATRCYSRLHADFLPAEYARCTLPKGHDAFDPDTKHADRWIDAPSIWTWNMCPCDPYGITGQHASDRGVRAHV